MKTYDSVKVHLTEKLIVETIENMKFETLSHPAGYIMVGYYGKKRRRTFFFSEKINGKFVGVEPPISNKMLSGKTYNPAKMEIHSKMMNINENTLWTIK